MSREKSAIFPTTLRGFNMTKKSSIYCAIALVPIFLIPSGCAPVIPPDALKLNAVSLERKQLQTRRFEGISEDNLLSACNGVLQDLGFNLDESETDLGVLVASKQRDATNPWQVAGKIALAFMSALSGSSPSDLAIDKAQKIRISLVARPASTSYEGDESHLVRITFQRIIWNTQGKITRREGIYDAEIYQEFFEKLSKAVFLEAEQI